jgi:5-methylcytosine-specific restriction enzyme subunit McrC
MIISSHEHAKQRIASNGHVFKEQEIAFHNNKEADVLCLKVTHDKDAGDENACLLTTGYYVGVDWLDEQYAVVVAPKINEDAAYTDYMTLLTSCMHVFSNDIKHRDLFEIKFDKPYVAIQKHQDLLSPLLIAYFLQLVKTIVKKGIRKSYYKVEENLRSRIKGKILIPKTLKKNVFKGEVLNNYCAYDEFGPNNRENKILKKTLIFIRRFISALPLFNQQLGSSLSACLSAFEQVDDDVDVKRITSFKHNPLFKEYGQALELSKLILARFGYNEAIVTAAKTDAVLVPPYWINMPMLFELHVLAKLKQKYGNAVNFQVLGSFGWRPDFLLATDQQKIIIDAKYKPRYQAESKGSADDIRQISGYARDSRILKQLDLNEDQQHGKPVDCLIIYTDQSAAEELPDNLLQTKINGLVNFYKLPIRLPIID